MRFVWPDLSRRSLHARAAEPAWWTGRGVLATNAVVADFAPALLGQLKWMATNACDELESELCASDQIMRLKIG